MPGFICISWARVGRAIVDSAIVAPARTRIIRMVFSCWIAVATKVETVVSGNQKVRPSVSFIHVPLFLRERFARAPFH